jgi:hypothetical protein
VPAHLTPAALAKAKALAVVTAALTAGGAGGMIALSTVSSSGPTQVVVSTDSASTPTTDPTQTPTETPTPTLSPTAAATAATPYALPSCPADVKNHGAYVASVAQAAPKGKDGAHGSWVSQAARSDCGKAAGASDSPEPDQTDSPETHSPKPVKSAPHHSGSAGTQHGGHGSH